MPTLEFPIDEIPFSMRGSWLSVSRVVGLHRSAELIHLVSHQTGMHPVLSFQPMAGGAPVETTEFAAPERLRWVGGAGEFTAAFADVDTVRVRGAGLGLRLADAAGGLTPFSGTYLFIAPQDGAAVLTSYETGRRYRITVARRRLLGDRLRALWARGSGRSRSAATEATGRSRSRRCRRSRRPSRPTRVVRRGRRGTGIRVHRVRRRASRPGATSTPAAALAAYVLWSATVRPLGFVTRETVLMSKHWMDKVWSWDHCFNALALAPSHPELAIDQFLVVFDHQVATGALPDSVTHSEVLYNFVKPPDPRLDVVGAAATRFPTPCRADVLLEVYRRLAAWTRYWLDHRRGPGATLPFYEHGNDSGWDNSTVFDLDRVVESPDLAAFLVLQLDELARLADEVGSGCRRGLASRERAAARSADARAVGRRAVHRALRRRPAGREHVEPARRHCRSSRAIGCPTRSTRAAGREGHGAPHRVRPGDRAAGLPALRRRRVLARARSGRRRRSSSRTACARPAATELADDVSERFRRLCERSGFAENFDALTGAGLRDRAYTWTASAYLLLAGQASERSMAMAAMAGEMAGGT